MKLPWVSSDFLYCITFKMFICNKIKQVVFPKIPTQKGRFQINSLMEKLWNQMTLDFQNTCFNFIITLMDFLLIPKSNTESAVISIKVLGVACWEKRCSAKANIFSHLESQSNFDFFIFMSARLIINMINIKTSQNFKKSS